jgi:SAM-dependent methyltransferase
MANTSVLCPPGKITGRTKSLWRFAAGRRLRRTVAIILALGLARSALGQTAVTPRAPVAPMFRAADVLTLAARCGSADPIEGSYELTRQRAFAGQAFAGQDLLAFEENRFFIYALGEAPSAEATRAGLAKKEASPYVRRFLFLKPSTFLVDDLVRSTASPKLIRWGLDSDDAQPEITGRRVRIAHPDGELLCETLLPQQVKYESMRLTLTSPETPGLQREEHLTWVVPQDTSPPVRFLHLLHIRTAGRQEDEAKAELAQKAERLELTVRTPDRVFRLSLPAVSAGAGAIEVAKADGETLLARRLLPSGVLPHGPEGVRLLERWDSAYRRSGRPGWDTGRPSSELKQAVEEGTLRPCRAVEMGCGSGTNAVYLAAQGFDVTAIDVAPTALSQAQEKAKKAGAGVRWLLADVLAPPKLEPFDLIYDRGCYHGVRGQNAAAYVEAIRRLSHPGTRILILAGNANDPRRGGGPPKVREEEIRADFASGFEFEWLRETRFDTRDPEGQGALAWSILLRKNAEP